MTRIIKQTEKERKRKEIFSSRARVYTVNVK